MTDKRGAPRATSAARVPAGAESRRIAAEAIGQVINRGRALDETLDALAARAAQAGLPERDIGLARAIATVGVRHFGFIRTILMERLRDGMPEQAGDFPEIMVAAMAQLLWMDVPDHAAVDIAVSAVRADRHSTHLAGLANAVLRRVGRERDTILRDLDPLRDNTPEWLAEAWVAAYGAPVAAAIAAAHLREPSVDLSVKADPAAWAERLDAIVLPTGSLRLRNRAALTGLPGFTDGAWWVQDAAAALPARLLAAKPGERVADLCAAPGGKTAQLALAGAQVVAVDRAAPRLERLKANLARLGLAAEVIADDALTFTAEPFDAILLDAPCTATGTLRRHPDVAWAKQPEDVAKLAALQRRLLGKAVSLLKPGGRLVYCVCSLQREEGEAQVNAILQREPSLQRLPITPEEVPGFPGITAEGDVRTLPTMLPHDEPRLAGADGFFVARLAKT